MEKHCSDFDFPAISRKNVHKFSKEDRNPSKKRLRYTRKVQFLQKRTEMKRKETAKKISKIRKSERTIVEPETTEDEFTPPQENLTTRLMTMDQIANFAREILSQFCPESNGLSEEEKRNLFEDFLNWRKLHFRQYDEMLSSFVSDLLGYYLEDSRVVTSFVSDWLEYYYFDDHDD